ncbi:bifunctional tryptophan synthase trp1 [Arthrobotrys musiformis]|uniref:Multifunctional tryptophan biosynthesis protein n=1 Tax=Arthrobotrys musiformis TaxID=47236 RepID=A0AAV9VXI1_9PEZI
MSSFQATVLSHDDPQPKLDHASNLILIDNYDSFTYNVSQYLVLEGATVQVVRNDQITLQELIARNPTQLVVSPGPGHPLTDSGVSSEAIKYFTGKIPILGVCMGQQCMYTTFGGTVASANEILHGKTSDILHDRIGVYKDVDQSIPVTRYHSLAGTYETLPSCLEVTSWTGDRGVIMGVRHKEFVVEGVQYHPESILTLAGRQLFRNFLKWKGGKWSDNDPTLTGDVGHSNAYEDWRRTHQTAISTKPSEPSILDKIYADRKRKVAAQKQIPGQRPEDLLKILKMQLAPPLIDFAQRLKNSPYPLALLAEVKRASPSKGIIDIDTNAAVQAHRYALSGAAAISVLTEPEWFKGSIEDMRNARLAVDGLTNRPAILRKEFIFDEYQILEARLAGADTVLLIVKMLSDDLLERLYKYSLSLSMEPLVEVSSAEEMTRALRLNAKVIGVNNRDLHSFNVDLGTTSSLVSMVPKDTILIALSGISERKDVERYEKDGAHAVLVGESLMRAGEDPKPFIEKLMSTNSPSTSEAPQKRLLVKICGTRTPEAAQVAAEHGADLVGVILVEGSKRCIGLATASQISETLRNTRKGGALSAPERLDSGKDTMTEDFFKFHLRNTLSHPERTLLVGVFQNQSLSYILHAVRAASLDIVQLHGQEPIEWASLIPVPVVHVFKPGETGLGTCGYHVAPLLDAGNGGSGSSLDISEVRTTLDSGIPALLAGGLSPDNVKDLISKLGGLDGNLGGVDVSSGVETDGQKDLEKIKRFIAEARS